MQAKTLRPKLRPNRCREKQSNY